MVENLAYTERSKIREDDHYEGTEPIGSLQQILRAKGDPEDQALGDRRERFRNREILPPRHSKKDRGQDKNDDRIRACSEPDPAQHLLPKRKS